MSFKVGNISDLLDKLKCAQCEKILSVLPIYSCAVTGNVCGRCIASVDWMVSNGTLERATAYEAVATYLVFPCCNKKNGCNAALMWNQVEEHERSCICRTLMCPFGVKTEGNLVACTWNGNSREVIPHLQANHGGSVQQHSPSFEMDVTKTNFQVYVAVVSEQTFVIITKYVKDTNKFCCGVMCVADEPENQLYRFQLEMGKTGEYFLILRKNNTLQLMNASTLINDPDKVITVDVSSVAEMLDDPNCKIRCKIGIVKKSKKEIAAVMKLVKPDVKDELVNKISASAIHHAVDSKNAQENVNLPKLIAGPPEEHKNSSSLKKPQAQSEKQNLTKTSTATTSAAKSSEKAKCMKKLSEMDKLLLEELECPVCNNHMIPPIFICAAGHSICCECKVKVKHCPTCRTQIENARNYTLEKVTAKVQYPCRYEVYGCPEISSCESIRVHEHQCIHAVNKCPLRQITSCSDGKSEFFHIASHIHEKHGEYLVYTGQIYARNIKAKVTSSYYAAIHENEIFIICCKHSPTIGPIKFNFLHVGMKKDEPKFKFEMEFVDQTKRGMKFIVNRVCQEFSQNLSNTLKNCLTIPLELLTPFILAKPEPTLYFKFYIQKL